jgi:glycosyltransferase 2 family protein
MAILRRLAATWWIRALVTVGLLAVVASRVDFGDASKRFSGDSWGWLVAAIVALFASFLVAAVRWHILLRAASIDATLQEATQTYLIGAFSTNFLPSQVGGDATRAWLAGSTGNRIRAATTVVVDRATGLGCLILMAWAFCVVRSGEIPRALVLALAAATVVAVIAGLVAGGVLRGNRRIGGWFPERAGAWAGEARLAVRSALEWPVLWRVVVVGVAFQALVVLSAWFIVRALALDIPLSILVVTLPPVLILAAAPVSIAGYGVREGSFVVLLAHAGVNATDATLLSLLTAVDFAIASSPGGLLLLRRSGRRGFAVRAE